MRALVALLALALGADAAGAGALDAGFSQDRRLLAFALTEVRPQGWQALVGGIVEAEGLSGRSQGLGFDLAPGLVWDGNINGGTAAETIELGGLIFVVDPESRAVAGFVPRLDLGLGKVVGVVPGFGIRASARLSLGHAVDSDLTVTSLSAEICSTQDLGHWTFADVCLSHVAQEKDLSQSEIGTGSLQLTHLFGSGAKVQRVALRLGQEVAHRKGRGLVRLDWEATTGFGLVSATAEWGQRQKGRQAMVARQALALHRVVAGAPMGLMLEHRRDSGEEFFGRSREEGTWAVTLERRLSPGVNVSLGYADKASSIGGFSEGQVVFGLSLAGLRH